MLKNFCAGLAILACTVGFAMAETVKGKITKIDGNKITVEVGKDKKVETFEAAGSVKVVKLDADKKATDVAGGLKAEPLQNLGKKGLGAILNVEGGKVTEITLQAPKKK